MTVQYIRQREWDSRKPWAADKVCIDSISVVANAGYDAWGRAKPQPVEVSIEVGLAGNVSSAASNDTLNKSTVHYGNLSKEILSKIPQEEELWQLPDAFAHWIAIAVRDFTTSSSVPAYIIVSTYYPKGSLQGNGSSLVVSNALNIRLISVVFHLHDLHVPALIGVNEHERKAKQSVVVNLWIDRLRAHMSNQCYMVEQLVVKTIEESSFETLESLCESIATKVIKYFIIAKQPLQPAEEPAGVRVRIAKPKAITLASAPAIEIYRSAEADDPFGKRMFTELGNKRPQVPFPLEGRLDDFLQAWKQD